MIKNILYKIFGSNSINEPQNFEQACDFTTRHKTSCKVDYNNDNQMTIELNDGSLKKENQKFTNNNKISIEEFFKQIQYLSQKGSVVSISNDNLEKEFKKFQVKSKK